MARQKRRIATPAQRPRLWNPGSMWPESQLGSRLKPNQFSALVEKREKTPEDIALLRREYDFAVAKGALLDAVVFYEGERTDEAERRRSLNDTMIRAKRELDRFTERGRSSTVGGIRGARQPRANALTRLVESMLPASTAQILQNMRRRLDAPDDITGAVVQEIDEDDTVYWKDKHGRERTTTVKQLANIASRARKRQK